MLLTLNKTVLIILENKLNVGKNAVNLELYECSALKICEFTRYNNYLNTYSISEGPRSLPQPVFHKPAEPSGRALLQPSHEPAESSGRALLKPASHEPAEPSGRALPQPASHATSTGISGGANLAPLNPSLSKLPSVERIDVSNLTPISCGPVAPSVRSLTARCIHPQ
jgi:hypothetical protein